jgi:hypothetical protein
MVITRRIHSKPQRDSTRIDSYIMLMLFKVSSSLFEDVCHNILDLDKTIRFLQVPPICGEPCYHQSIGRDSSVA